MMHHMNWRLQPIAGLNGGQLRTVVLAHPPDYKSTQGVRVSNSGSVNIDRIIFICGKTLQVM